MFCSNPLRTCVGDILVPLNTCSPRILVQFDGSAHRTRRVGGAGAALLHVECTGLALIDWGAQALPNCADNIVAETHGAELAISLYEKYRPLCQQQSLTPLPLDRIQGDIKPLLQHLDFRGRFFHAKRSRIAPGSILPNTAREKLMHLRTTLLDKRVLGSSRGKALRSQILCPFQYRLIRPITYFCKPMLSCWARTGMVRLR